MNQHQSVQSATSSTRSRDELRDDAYRAKALWGALATLAAGAILWRRAQTYRRDLAQLKRELPAAAPLDQNERLLIIAPHPDDEVLATGALIHQARAQNCAVRVVFLTNGDGSGSAYLAQHAREGRRPSFQQLAQTRQNEALAALRELGIEAQDAIFLGYPDGGLGAMSRENFNCDTPYFSKWTNGTEVPYSNALSVGASYAGENVVRDLVQVCEEFTPTRVYTTEENDTHADHVAAFEFTQRALQQWRETSPSETSSTRSEARPRFFTTLIHHHIWPVPHGLHLDSPLCPPAILSYLNWTHFAVDHETLKTKQRALRCYKSQLVWTPLYLRSFLRRTELFREIEVSEPRA